MGGGSSKLIGGSIGGNNGSFEIYVFMVDLPLIF